MRWVTTHRLLVLHISHCPALLLAVVPIIRGRVVPMLLLLLLLVVVVVVLLLLLLLLLLVLGLVLMMYMMLRLLGWQRRMCRCVHPPHPD